MIVHNHLTRDLRPDTCQRCASLIRHRETLLDRADQADSDRYTALARNLVGDSL